MMLDRSTAVVDRQTVARPQRPALRAAVSPDATRMPRRTGLMGCERIGSIHASGRTPQQAGAAAPRAVHPHPAFRFPTFLSNDSAGSDDGAVAGLEGAQTWASR